MRSRARTRGDQADGFSFVEVLVAMTLFVTALVSLAQLFAVATTNNTRARTVTFAAILAEQKMAQLRALALSVDAGGSPVTDESTDTTTPLGSAAGGTGLTPSPEASIRETVDGYVDYVDRRGNSLGGGSTPPRGTAYIRRWCIRSLTGPPLDSLAIRVAVTPLGLDTPLAVLASVKVRHAP